MQAAIKMDFISTDDYLEGEKTSASKHEFVGGLVYGMAGASKDHNQIALNITFATRSHLKGKPCRVFMSDLKVRLKIVGEDIFYYPDVMVGCDPRDTHRLFLDYPALLVEVASESTERLDRREKRLAYQTIETLEEYLIVAQDRVEVTLFRRADNWKPEIYSQLNQVVTLNSIGLTLAVSSIYEGIS